KCQHSGCPSYSFQLDLFDKSCAPALTEQRVAMSLYGRGIRATAQVLQITPTTVMKRQSARTAQSGACIPYSASHVSVRLSPLLRSLFPLAARSDYARVTAKALSSPLPPHGGCSSPILFCPRCSFPDISRAEQSLAPAHPPRHLAEKPQHSRGTPRRDTTVLL